MSITEMPLDTARQFAAVGNQQVHTHVPRQILGTEWAHSGAGGQNVARLLLQLADGGQLRVLVLVRSARRELQRMAPEIVAVLAYQDDGAVIGHRYHHDAEGGIDVVPVELVTVGHCEPFAQEAFRLRQQHLCLNDRGVFDRDRGNRLGDFHDEALALMAELADTIDTSIRDAVTGLRDRGYSWADIGSRLGVTRQAAQQHWGNRP
jgi:hypothetical protein